jgi:hypothetical protein
LRVFENRVLRRIFGPEREEDESWRKLHSDELHNLGHAVRMGEIINAYKVLVGKYKGERPL